VRPDGASGYVLDGYGGLHLFGGAPASAGAGAAYWLNWDIARAIALRPRLLQRLRRLDVALQQ
jgi:hypothetical protein